jgi:hypothetical protein
VTLEPGSQQSCADVITVAAEAIAHGTTPFAAIATSTHAASRRDMGGREAVIGTVTPSWARVRARRIPAMLRASDGTNAAAPTTACTAE